MDKFVYYITVFFIRLFGLLPFSAIYKISDFLSFVLFYLVKYRRSVVYKNLKLCFPEKSEKEIRDIARKNYTNLSDLIVEAMKGFSMDFNDISKRYRIVNPEILDPYFEEGRSVIIFLNHFGNWEWARFCSKLGFKHKIIVFYKPLANTYIDEYLRETRVDMGMSMVSFYDIQKTLIEKKNEVYMYILVGDQSPTNLKKAVWANFFNIETACVHGSEKYAVQTGYPIIFANIQRIKRGCYELTAKLLFENAQGTAKGEVTQVYMKELEEMIRKTPQNWLWSHKRWKHKKIYDQK